MWPLTSVGGRCWDPWILALQIGHGVAGTSGHGLLLGNVPKASGKSAHFIQQDLCLRGAIVLKVYGGSRVWWHKRAIRVGH